MISLILKKQAKPSPTAEFIILYDHNRSLMLILQFYPRGQARAFVENSAVHLAKNHETEQFEIFLPV